MQALTGLPGSHASLRGAIAGIDGEDAAIHAAETLAKSMDMKPVHVPADRKALYHAAAVTVAGHATALFRQAQQMLEQAGFDPDQAQAGTGDVFV